MTLDPDVCWAACSSRDRRFDGRFFTAVTTTHIYCRPGCPAKMPSRRNVRFYASAAAAESAGFRPCRRCRPETSPGSAAWIGAPALVARAMRLIEGGALGAHGNGGAGHGVEALASRLGIGGRRLRQLFAEHVGASPLEVARTHRAHLARRLLETTTLPLEDIAQAAGYASARRLHAALRASFRASPGELRTGRRPGTAGAAALELRLPARAPFDAAPLLRFFAARGIAGLAQVANGAYGRSYRLGDDIGRLAARPDATGVTLSVSSASARALVPVAARITRMFDLEADTVAIAAHLRRDPAIHSLVPVDGVRVPGAWDPFEHSVRALLGQQVTVAGACTLAARIVARCGEALPPDLADERITHVFPTPERLAAANLDGLGITGARIRAIHCLARAVAERSLDLGAHDSLEGAVAALVALPGIGDWTANYIALRGLGEPDAFPAGDLGVRKALARNGKLASEQEAVRRAEPWRPWRGYAVIALWTHEAPKPRLEATGKQSTRRTPR